MKKKPLIALAIAVIGYVAYYVLMPHEGPALDAKAKAYLEATLPPILTRWDVNAMQAQLKTPDVSFTQQFTAYAVLGTLSNFGAPQGHCTVKGASVSCIFATDATFSKGKALIDITATREHGDWKILNLSIVSPALMPPNPLDMPEIPQAEPQPSPSSQQ